MKRQQDMDDLFALSEVVEPELAERARMAGTSSASSIYISRSIHSSGYDRRVLDFYDSSGGEFGSHAAAPAASRPCCNATATT